MEPGSAPSDYSRTLDLRTGIQETVFTVGGVRFRGTAFTRHPDGVIVNRQSADRKGALSAAFRLQGTHSETPTGDGHGLRFDGRLPNGIAYAALVRVVARGGAVRAAGAGIECRGCDEILAVLGAGTSYVADAARGWHGPDPGPRMEAQVSAAARRTWMELRERHLKDDRSLFGRVDLDLGRSAPAVRA